MTSDLAPAPSQSTADGVGMATNKGPTFSRRAETHHHGDTHTHSLSLSFSLLALLTPFCLHDTSTVRSSNHVGVTLFPLCSSSSREVGQSHGVVWGKTGGAHTQHSRSARNTHTRTSHKVHTDSVCVGQSLHQSAEVGVASRRRNLSVCEG